MRNVVEPLLAEAVRGTKNDFDKKFNLKTAHHRIAFTIFAREIR